MAVVQKSEVASSLFHHMQSIKRVDCLSVIRVLWYFLSAQQMYLTPTSCHISDWFEKDSDKGMFTLGCCGCWLNKRVLKEIQFKVRIEYVHPADVWLQEETT